MAHALNGWFWRFTRAGTGDAVIVMCAVNRAADGEWGFVGLAGHPGGFDRALVVDSALARDGRVECERALRFDGRALQVDLGADARLEATLVDLLLAPPRGLLRAAQLTPGLSQYWHPYLLGARVSGSAVVGGRAVSLDGARVYAERNWGGAFPRSWWWGQAHDFADPEVSVAFAGGPVRLGRLPLPLRAGGVLVRVGRRRFEAAVVGEGGWALRARSGRHVVDIEGEPAGAAHRLSVPVPAERRAEPGSHHHLDGRLVVTVRRRGRVVYSGESTLAGLELGAVGSRP